MQLTLEIRTESWTSKTVVLQPGQSIKIGRLEKADVALREDTLVSNIHCAIEGDGQGWQVRDLKSRFGTFVNKTPAKEPIRLQDGDQIAVGGTTITVRGGEGVRAAPALAPQPQRAAPLAPEAPPVPRREPASAQVSAATLPERVLQVLRSQAEPVYALLDAARNPRVLSLLRESGEEYQSLYEEAQDEEMAEVGPWLVRLSPQSAFLERLVREGWGNSWGVYLSCGQPFAEVRKHFRRFLLVQVKGGPRDCFRYYDPRILRPFLPTCTPQQLQKFFGPVQRFLAEGGSPQSMVRFDNFGNALVVEETDLSQGVADQRAAAPTRR